jgi:hypothetical protein
MKNREKRFNLLFILLLFYATWGHAQTSYFETSTPEAQGMSSLNILKFIDRLEAEIDAAHSFMIIKHGKLVSQGWWDPYQAKALSQQPLDLQFKNNAFHWTIWSFLFSQIKYQIRCLGN